MSRPTTVYYPRGYRRLVGAGTENMPEVIHKTDGDEEVTELMKALHSTEVDVSEWSFINRVLTCAARLLPDFNEFCNHQQRNPHVHGVAYDFLNEVVRFIATGRHQTSPLTAIELMDNYPKRQTVGDRRGFYNRRARNPLALWLTQPNGLHDMVETLYVFFGPCR